MTPASGQIIFFLLGLLYHKRNYKINKKSAGHGTNNFKYFNYHAQLRIGQAEGKMSEWRP